MAEFSISLSDIQDIRTVEIKGLGDLNIRKLGSGESLDISRKSRRMNELFNELEKMDFASPDIKKPSDVKKLEKLSKRAEEIGEEIADIQTSEFEVYKRLLSDNKNGAVVDVIMNTLTDKARAEVFKIAFGEKKPIETPEAVAEASDA